MFRLFAFIFVLMGIVLLTYFYFTQIQGNIMQALRDPTTVVLILLPFVPAVIFSWIASKADKELIEYLRKMNEER